MTHEIKSISRYDWKDKHVFVVGGGGGIGRALVEQVVPLGASVTICTKDPEAAEPLIKELETKRLGSSQKMVAVKGSVNTHQGCLKAVQEGVQGIGSVPDVAILTAGHAEQGSFLEHPPEVLEEGIILQYWANAWPAYVLAKEMNNAKKAGHIIWITNILAEESWQGFSAYSPGKYAVKGLADTLRVELAPKDIAVSFFPLSGYFGGHGASSTRAEEDQALNRSHGFVQLQENLCAIKVLAALEKGIDGRLP